MKAKETLGSQGDFIQREYRRHLNVPRATIPTETIPRSRSKQFALKLQHDLGGGFRKPRASVGKLLLEKAR